MKVGGIEDSFCEDFGDVRMVIVIVYHTPKPRSCYEGLDIT